MDLVSIILPYFKKRKFIFKTIRSVINQSHKNFELIIIYDDDNKNDLSYLKSITKKEKRVKIIINKKNIGAGLSRNIGIKKSKGRYIAFIDGDDLWLPKKISIQLKQMKSNNYNISHTSYSIINNNKKIIGQRIARTFNSVQSLIKSCDIGLSTVMIKKSILKNKDHFAQTITKEDFIFWIRLLSRNIKIHGINIKLVKWRKLDNSLSSSVIQKLKDGYLVYNKYLNMNPIKSIYYLFLLSINSILKGIN